MKNRNEDNAEFTISQHFYKIFLKYFINRCLNNNVLNTQSFSFKI